VRKLFSKFLGDALHSAPDHGGLRGENAEKVRAGDSSFNGHVIHGDFVDAEFVEEF
jgi:hypothetical protein